MLLRRFIIGKLKNNGYLNIIMQPEIEDGHNLLHHLEAPNQ